MATQVPAEFTTIRYHGGKATSVPAEMPKTLGPHEAVLKISHSGVCHTDLLFVQAGSPLSLGHEGVGTVVAVGSEVTSLQVGDVAGAGFQRYNCGECTYCLKGHTTACVNRKLYGTDDQDHGTFGTYYIGDARHLYKIPEGLAPEDAAPLQCAGATVYSALVDTIRAPGTRVGVLGIGGLGHLAIQFAAKMGCEVVVFSTSASKEAEARSFGATEFVLLGEVEKVSRPVEVLLLTGAKYPDWTRFLTPKVLAPEGVIVPLNAPSGDLVLPGQPMFWHTYKVHASLVASREQHRAMLEFAARHGIKPTVELYPNEGPQTVEKVFHNLEKGIVRYRAVLVM